MKINQCQCCYKSVSRKEFMLFVFLQKNIIKIQIIEKYQKLKRTAVTNRFYMFQILSMKKYM